ncbi:MAG: ABC transporter permease [Rhizobiaceae bacterium]|nr:ABC transporter permease [Rhizobiaceae bacterium]
MALLPAGGFYALVFALPVVALLVLSFWTANGFKLIPGFTLDNYVKILTSPLYRALMLRTIGVAFATTAIVVPVAFALAYCMRFVFERRGQMILQIILLSLFSGYLVRIYAWRTILGKQGLLNSTLQWLGLIDQPLEFLIYSNTAVVITLSGLLLPLAVLPLYSAMLNVPRDFLEAARDLGAGKAYCLRTVLVPMVMPGLRTAFAFAFLLSAGDFVTPSLVGGTQSLLIGNVIADQFRGIGSNWPLGAAMAFVVVAVMLCSFLAVVALIGRATRW